MTVNVHCSGPEIYRSVRASVVDPDNWIRIRLITPDADPDADSVFLFDADPDTTFHSGASKKKAQTREKVLKKAHIPYILA